MYLLMATLAARLDQDRIGLSRFSVWKGQRVGHCGSTFNLAAGVVTEHTYISVTCAGQW